MRAMQASLGRLPNRAVDMGGEDAVGVPGDQLYLARLWSGRERA